MKQTQAGVSFVTSLDRLTLRTDEARLQQVLINLLINATKFTTEGSITLTLEKESETIALFTVTDTGCGIPADKHKEVFERFSKLNAFTPGNGLGLYLCQLIIRRLSGKISIDPTYTGGTRITVILPVQ